MNTLIDTPPWTREVRPEAQTSGSTASERIVEGAVGRCDAAPNAGRGWFEDRSRGRTACLAGSLLAHLLVFSAIATTPASPLAETAPLLEVDLLPVASLETQEPDSRTPEPAALPRGTLDSPQASRTAAPSTRAPSPMARPEPATAPANVVTSDNPYANGGFAIYTSGTANAGSSVKRASATARGTQGSAPGFGAPHGSTRADPGQTLELENWLRQVRARLGSRAAQSYPRRARRLEQEGTARLSVSIGPQGEILSVDLIQTSGHENLDQAALAGLRAVGTVPAPPSGVGTTSVAFPVTFRLN